MKASELIQALREDQTRRSLSARRRLLSWAAADLLETTIKEIVALSAENASLKGYARDSGYDYGILCEYCAKEDNCSVSDAAYTNSRGACFLWRGPRDGHRCIQSTTSPRLKVSKLDTNI